MGLFFRKKKEPAINNEAKGHFAYDFRMMIDDVFTITGRGTIVVGQINMGACRVGENVVIETRMGTIESTITGLEAFRKQLDMAYAGQHVGVLLRGVSKEQLTKGDTIRIYNAGIYS